jgi:hypothetical protein
MTPDSVTHHTQFSLITDLKQSILPLMLTAHPVGFRSVTNRYHASLQGHVSLPPLVE